MNTFISENVTFHYNKDFNGEILMVDHKTTDTFVIDAKELLKFVADYYVLPRRISKLLDSDYNDILK